MKRRYVLGFIAVLALVIAGRAAFDRFSVALEVAASERIFSGPVRTWWGPLVRTATVVEDVAYVGIGTELAIVDLAVEERPALLGKHLLGGIVHGFCQDDRTMFVAHGPTGLTAFDIRAPREPVVLARYATGGYGMHCALEDGRLLFSDEMSGWDLLDVSDPTRFKRLAHVDGGWVSAAALDGDIAYVLDGRTGFDVFDISDPARPERVARVPISLPEEVYEPDPPPIWLELQGGYAFVSNGSDGLRVISVHDPRNPVLVGHLPIDGYTYTVAVQGDRAYVANINLGLLVVDISTPTRPRLLGSCTTPGGAYDIIFHGERGYLSDGANGFMVIDTTRLDTPQMLGYWHSPPATRGVTLSDDLLITSNGSAGAAFFDVSDALAPRFLSSLDTKGLLSQVAVHRKGRAIFADVLGGSHVVDIHDPRQPRLVSTFIPEDHPWGIVIDGDYGYVANGHHGFSVIDLRPEVPVHLANDYSYVEYDPDSWDEDAGSIFGYLIRSAKAGDLAFATDVVSGLFVYDVSDPSKPVRLATHPRGASTVGMLLRGGTLPSAIGVTARDGFAYLAAYDRGLEVLDLEDPAQPHRVHRTELEGHAYGVALEGDRLGVTEYEGRFHLFDISAPDAPRKLETRELRGALQDLVLTPDAAYVAAGPAGLAVVPLDGGEVTYYPPAHPEAPALACSFD